MTFLVALAVEPAPTDLGLEGRVWQAVEDAVAAEAVGLVPEGPAPVEERLQS